MKRRISLLGLATLTVAVFGCSPTGTPANAQGLPSIAPGRYEETMKAGNTNRRYILRVPKAYNATKPLPLVVVLHGWTASAKLAEVYTGMAEGAEQNGYIAVFPDGLGQMQGWNAGFIDLTGLKPDDVGFIDSLLDEVQKKVGVDKDRVYVAGHSNGAFMSHLLASRLSDRIAAIGAVAGTIGVPGSAGPLTIPDPKGPVSAILIHGKKDATVAYDESSKALLRGVSAPRSAKWWAERIGASTTPRRTESGGGNVVTELYTGGRNGTEVALVSIANGLHDWPGGVTRNGRESLTGVNATDLIFAFFNSHPKRR